MNKNITDDAELKEKTYKFMEDATKLGYWCRHSIVLCSWDKSKRKLTIEIETPEHSNDKVISYIRGSTLKNEAKILDIIVKNPGVSPKKIEQQLEDIMSSRTLSNRLKSMVNKGLVKAHSKSNSKNDPTRRYYPTNHE